ncbi:hypothetical protein HCN44_000475 [Aphidius gifuensis]|uniref:Proteasome activator complex subunit 4 n=1 Tax=Aphidius gifuensis TaxID=684658 RepID=A0A834XRY4_APHGI|nr:proteasome activator complex subunit 4-like [Aphidius gifuensis]XP_044011319.1 proteasome activator complex subunit 4-like [Aphidius gifuensis]XP_044011320.1 proteasome activator complex subunit 4-like [Aphidius gifuensis]KAF7990670.1 hypothetical protein HCN44_000475 [Aphidius gifuensis]
MDLQKAVDLFTMLDETTKLVYNMREDDDDITMESSTESLGLDYQAVNKYNDLLPYAEELEKEAKILLPEIKGQLGQAIMLRRIEPDTLNAVGKLRMYMKLYSLRFTKEDHILLIKLMYELVTIPELEQYLVNVFGGILLNLLRKRELIEPSELVLEWRPLYDLKKRSVTMPSNSMYRFSQRCLKMIESLICDAKIYFPLTATREILDELRPQICPLDTRSSPAIFDLLDLFLPVQLFPNDSHMGYGLWFDEFMKLWEICNNAPVWEHSMMTLMSRLAWFNIGYIDWEPYIPIMTTRFMRCLNLPVHYKNTKIPKSHKVTTNSVAIWVVSILGNKSSGQFHLEKFLKTIETYLHQANTGPWIDGLKDFLCKLTIHFVRRLHNERYKKKTWQTTTPETHKLTDTDVDNFVKSMMPLAMTSMFGLSNAAATSKVFRHLATIRPNLVIPDVLDRLYLTLDSLTEPHKLTAAMSAVTSIARPLVQGCRNINKGYTYNEGPSRVLSLLFSSLPGIDANDFMKCFSTFRLISVYASMIPIVDCSHAIGSNLIDDDDRLVCETTSQFEDFILQFFDRVFILIESSTLEYVSQENQEHRGNKSKIESMIEFGLDSVCSSILNRCSNDIFQSALHKLRSFVTEKVLETRISGPLAASLCRSFARANGRETLKSLLPTLTQIIMEIIQDNDDVKKEENLDDRLLYSMLLVSSITSASGDTLFIYKDLIIELLDKILHLKSREGSRISSRILCGVLNSLSTITTKSHYTYDGRDYNDTSYPYILDWGQGIDKNQLNVDWYIPGEDELSMLQELFSRYITIEINNIENYCSNTTTPITATTKSELLTTMTILLALVDGLSNYLPIPNEYFNNCDDETSTFLPYVGIKGEIKMPDGSNVKKSMVKLLTKLQNKMLENHEDDPKSLAVLPRIWSAILLGESSHMDQHKRLVLSWNQVKYELRDDLIKKRRHMVECILERCHLQHEIRIFSRFYPLTEYHKFIMLQLFKLSTTTYAQVRIHSQDVLFSALGYFPTSRNIFIPDILELLAKDPEEHHDAHKGLLYLLAGPRPNALIVPRSWEFLKNIWPALVLSKPSEKPSVIRLKNNLTETISRYMPTIGIKLFLTDKSINIASELWMTYPKPLLTMPNIDDINNGKIELLKLEKINETYYDELIDSILTGIQTNCHWRQRSMGMRLLRDLAHPDRNYPIKVVNYFLNALINDTLQERKIAILTVSSIMQQLKRKHNKITIDTPNLVIKNGSIWNDVTTLPGLRDDNAWLQYNYNNRPLNEQQWNEPRYIHKQYNGYYTWPKKLEIYAPSSEQPILDKTIRIFNESELLIENFFIDSSNVDKLMKYNSLEERKGKDKFNNFRFLFYKRLFRNHGITHLNNFLIHLKYLVKDKQESHQLCAAELIAGLIRGSKHWPFNMVNDMWNLLLPIIGDALNNISTETVNDWALCFGSAVAKRDPNRHHWLYECLMEYTIVNDSTASLHESSILFCLQTMLLQQSWRLTELMKRLLIRVENRLIANPFQNIRDCLGSVITSIFSADYDPGTGVKNNKTQLYTEDFINKYLPNLLKLTNDDDHFLELDGKKESVSLLKTLCKWLITNGYSSQYGSLPSFSLILPVLCQLENYEPDDELRLTCRRALSTMSESLRLPRHMDKLFNDLFIVSNMTSWSARSSCLSFIEVFVFYNMGVILNNKIWTDKVLEIVMRLLSDDRVEVREKAGNVLCGLLHCNFIAEQDKLLKQLKNKSKIKINNNDDLRVRHAGVLGLCAFVRAHPYDLPKYVPSIFEYLNYCLNDPQPIPTTIRKTLGDFKRTHYDGWTVHAQCFTEEQLGILQDLSVPPSHYA